MSGVGVNKWPGGLLDRATVGGFLTSYLVNRYAEADGTVDFETFVLNLNSEWGGGKTFFLNRMMSFLVFLRRIKNEVILKQKSHLKDYIKAVKN